MFGMAGPAARAEREHCTLPACAGRRGLRRVDRQYSHGAPTELICRHRLRNSRQGGLTTATYVSQAGPGSAPTHRLSADLKLLLPATIQVACNARFLACKLTRVAAQSSVLNLGRAQAQNPCRSPGGSQCGHRRCPERYDRSITQLVYRPCFSFSLLICAISAAAAASLSPLTSCFGTTPIGRVP